MEDKIGIWIDKRTAFVIKLTDKESDIQKIDSPLEFYHPKGGSRSRIAYGPMDTVKEKAYLEREGHQKKLFFEKIMKEIGGFKYIFIFGPAQMKDELKKYIEGKHGISPEMLICETADSMTPNQMIAEVRDVFRHV